MLLGLQIKGNKDIITLIELLSGYAGCFERYFCKRDYYRMEAIKVRIKEN